MEDQRCRLRHPPGVENGVVGIEQRPVFRKRGRPLQYAQIAENDFLIAARLHRRFFILRQPPAVLITENNELLPGAYAFSPPPCDIEQVVIPRNEYLPAGKRAVLA